MADMVDLRAPRAGRSCFVGDRGTCVAGDAGIVLNLFLPSAKPLEDPFVKVEDRTVREVLMAVIELLRLSESGLLSSLELIAMFFSPIDDVLPGIRRAAADVGGLFSDIFEAAEGVSEARFAIPDTMDLFASALGLPDPFFSPSMEPMEERER